MDPISALIVGGLLLMAAVKTAGSTVTDVMAQHRGKTPPSLEKWRARNQQRARRGGNPRGEPGPMRRRFQNALDQHAERSHARGQAKHEGKIAHLQATHPERVQAEHAKLARRDQRRATVRATTGRVAGVAAEGVKAAVSPEHRRERAAWHENQRRDQQPADSPHADQQSAAVADQDTLGFEHRTNPDGTETVTVTDADGSQTTVDPNDPATGGGTEHNGRAIQPITGELPDSALPDGALATVTRINLDQLDHSPDKEGTPTMPAGTMHSGEITNLSEATAYVQSGSAYCDQISGTFEDARAQATATAQDVQHMVATVENAQSSLAGQGLNEAAGQLAGVQEHLATLLANMQQVETLLASTEEAIASARANLDSAGQTFTAQQGIAEEMSAHREVADNTSFYQEA